MNKKQKQKMEKLLKMLPIAIMLAVVITIGMFLNASAADQDVDANVIDPDCIWSDGPGTELYVASGKTCTINENTSAKNLAGWTDYAVIVYAGGTLEIVGNPANTSLSVDGDMYVLGTVNIGNDTANAITNTIVTSNTLGNGDIYVMGASGVFNVTTNTGGGENYFTTVNDMQIGDATDPSAAVLNIKGDSTANDVGNILSTFDTINVDDGRIDVDNLRIQTPNTGYSNMTIADGAAITLDAATTTFSACIIDGQGNKCTVEVGANTGSGLGSILTVNGSLSVPVYASDDVSVKIGGGTKPGTLSVGTTGTVDINETSDFSTPGDPSTTTNNSLYIGSDSPAGLITAGLVDSEMFVFNQGDISVSSAGTTGKLEARYHYKQNSGLTVNSGDTMNITGTANVDGTSQIDGTLNVTACTRIHDDTASTTTFDVAGTFDTNTADTGCNLTNTSSNDGLNVQDSLTTMTIDNGADVDITGDFRVDDGGDVDANGFFIVSSGGTSNNLVIEDGGTMSMDDTGATDYFEAEDFQVEPSAGGASSSLAVEDSSVFDLQGGEVNIGTSTSSGTGALTVNGTVNVPTASTDDFKVGDSGSLTIESDGTVNADASAGLFQIEGGVVTVRGTLGNPGTLHIADQELEMSNATTTAYLSVGTSGLAYGVITSEATPATAPGYDYNSGILEIEYNSSATFDDSIDIDTTNNMIVGGYLEGTDLIEIGCTGTTCKVEPSGEIKVVGTGTPAIKVEQDMDLLGKLNGDDGAGDVTVVGATTATISSIGTASEDSYTYIIANDFDIESGASIDVSDFVNCYDPGGTPTYGGSYGGEGAGGNTATFGAVKYTTAPVYPGTANPVGMCGFDNSGVVTSYGGGAIYIEVHNDINLSGAILANGEATIANTEGAGSGGLIVINHNIAHTDTSADFTGSSNIEANGGNATGTTNSYGGGGGRIIIDSILFEEPDDSETGEPHYEYTGGVYITGGKTNNGTTDYAASGTIVYLGDDNNSNGTLISDAGNRTPESGKEVYIQTTGSPIFDRIHARDGAIIKYDAAPATDPISCFATGTGSAVDLVTGTCTSNPDKPDVLHINNSQTTAQSGDEPWWSSTVTLNDRDPVFSIIPRNPEVSTDLNKLWIQVDTSTTFGAAGSCGGCVWDAAVTLDNFTSLGSRSEDFEYAGSALSASTTYYVRVAFYDNAGTNLGLWTHRDMDNHYKFTTTAAYYDIENSCSDLITITQTGLPAGDPIKATESGKRYGYGSCTFTIDTSTNTAWKVLYGESPTATVFNDGTGSYVLANIDNDGTGDAQIDTTGSTSEEEYGFNISPGTNLTTSNVETDPTISQKYDDWTTGVSGQYVFDIEDNGSEDKILEDNGNGAETAGEFDLNVYLNAADSTVAADYGLETWMILTDGP